MPRVTDITTEDLDFGDIAAKLAKAYTFLKWTADDRAEIKRLTPRATRRVAYRLTDANPALANGWRRTMLDEIEWPRLNCAMSDIQTDDPFNSRLTDYIQNRIWLVPTSYIARDKPVPRLVLEVKNTTQENRIVTSSDITWRSDKGDLDWDRNIELCNLMPGRAIRIAITVEWGTNRQHASFSNFHGVLYRPVTVKGRALDQSALPRSYTVHPDGFELGLTCENFVDPRHAAHLGWTTMQQKLEQAASYIAEFRTRARERGADAMPYLTDALNVTQVKGGVIRYEFRGESLTLANLLSWYAYVADPSIPYVTAGDDHPEDPSVLVRIVHRDHAAILEQAARTAAAECAEIAARFK